jgi:hypothetical protein
MFAKVTLVTKHVRLPCILWVLLVHTGGCGDCSLEIDPAGAFLRNTQNLSCTTDDDCVAVTTGCHTFDFGLCARAALSRKAAESEHWKQLSTNLEGCERSCERCDALLIARCVAGACGRSR